MAWVSRQSKLFLIVTFSIGIAVGLLAAPAWRWSLVQLHQAEYGDLTFKCDSAMRAHYLAKSQLSHSTTQSDVERLRQTELALIDCQDYDLMQKNLMMWGLRENELGLMRLKAIEADANGLKDVVESHEIRY